MPRPPGTTSTSLVRGLQRQDDDAWRQFLAIYRPYLIHLCRKAGVRGDAEDVADGAALKIFVGLRKFRRRRRGSFRAWLKKIVQREVANHFAAAKGEQRLVDDPIAEADDEQAYDQLALRAWELLEQQVEQGQFTLQTAQAFIEQKLRERPAGEVAAELNMLDRYRRPSANAVHQATHRVMEWLRSLSADEWLDRMAAIVLSRSPSERREPPTSSDDPKSDDRTA